MLRSVILIAGFILLAVVFIAPSLPTAEDTRRLSAAGGEGMQADDLPKQPTPATVDRLFESSDPAVVAHPAYAPSPERRDDHVVTLPAPGSRAEQDARSPEY